MECYFDNSATTRCEQEVIQKMNQIYRNDYGNPSSLHQKGVEAENYVKEAREVIAATLKASTKELIFTSGGTESNNLAILGTALANQRTGKHLITTQIEHPAVLNPMHFLEEQGFEVTYLSVDEKGYINLLELEDAIRPDTILVSIMYINNEIGTIEPIEKAGQIIKETNPRTLFHVDAIQAYGKIRIIPKRLKIDLMSVSSHKIHGPKGVGFLYIKEGTKIRPIIFGGGQQNEMRSGTENVPGVAGIGEAVRLCFDQFEEKQNHLYELRNHFINKVKELDGVTINGEEDKKGAPHIVSVSFEGVRSEVLLHVLEERNIFVSAGSACASHKIAPSRTLTQIGIDKELIGCTVRFSFSRDNSIEEIDYTVNVLKEQLPGLRKYMRH